MRLNDSFVFLCRDFVVVVILTNDIDKERFITKSTKHCKIYFHRNNQCLLFINTTDGHFVQIDFILQT